MTCSMSAVPHGHCHHPHHHHRRGESGRAVFAELLAMMGPGRGGPDDPFGGPGPGFGGPFGHRGFGPGPGRGRGRGGRARRGDIRSAILLLLNEEPRNGYGLMQEVEERSGGVWRPSPGSVYPALAQLEDEGLVRAIEVDGRKHFELTDAGREAVAQRPEGTLPWEAVAEGVPSELHDLRGAARSLAVAAMQVAQTGTKEQLASAQRILEDARRALYRLLAGDEPDGPDDAA